MKRGTSAVLAALIAVAVIVVVAAGGEDRTTSQGTSRTVPAGFQDTVARALPSVVQIESGTGLGSGVVLDDAGHVVTNAHVVAGAKKFRVTTSDGSLHDATLRGVFPAGDLAVISVAGAHLRPASSPTPRRSTSVRSRLRSATRSGSARASRRGSSARRAARSARATASRCPP